MAEESFVNGPLRDNSPVIVTDAMTTWKALDQWTPDYLRSKLGDKEILVYDDLFKLIGISDLAGYLGRNFDQPASSPAKEYVRAYARFKDVDFIWSDDLFEALADGWDRPYFFPNRDFALPRKTAGAEVSPVRDAFPYKGLFISGRGARTRLHRDPFCTDAMLCQFHGEKRLIFHEPQLADQLMKGTTFVDPLNVDAALFPDFKAPAPAFDDVLRPGEILFIPGGWFHDVHTLSDSISITWNFVHDSCAERYRRELDNPANDFDRDMLAYLGGV